MFHSIATRCALATIIAGTALPTFAADAPPPAIKPAIDVGISSLGLEIGASARVSPYLGVRGFWTGGLKGKKSLTQDQLSVNLDGRIGGVGAVLDVHPFQNGLRGSVGLFHSTTRLSGSGTISGGEAFSLDGRFKSGTAPMATVGYIGELYKGWSISGDLGAIFAGGVDLTFTATDPAQQSTVDNNTDVQKAIDDARKLTVYPYAALRVTYKF